MRFVKFAGLFLFFFVWLSVCPPLPAQQKAAESEAAKELLRLALSLMERGRFKDAVAPLERAVRAAPNSSTAHQWLGYAYFELGEREKAIRAYARALRLNPRSEDARTSLVRLLNDGLPAWADAETLETLREHIYIVNQRKVWERKEFAVDVNVAVRPPLPNDERRAFYTHGLLFAPQNTQDPSFQKNFNRVCMGYALDPNDNLWRLRFRVFYLSESAAEHGRNYAPLAEQVCATLLQLYWLAQQALNATTRFSPEKPTDVWLCEKGEVGAEQPANAPAHLYFYDINSPKRSPLEWLREIAHEYGHLTLPGIDGFERDVEPYINGHVGERLFLLWLTAQALKGTGDGGRGTGGTEDAIRNPQSAIFEVSPQELAAYVRDRSYPALRRFLDEGPRSPLVEDVGLRGMEFLIGFLLYVERTHDSALTQAFLDDAKKQVTVFLTGRAVFDSYARTMDKLGAARLSFYPTVPAPKFSRLSQPRSAEQLAQNAPPTLREGDEAAYWVYLPSGGRGIRTLEVTARASSQGILAVNCSNDFSRYDKEPLPAGSSTKVTFNLPAARDGWQLVRVKWQSGASPVTLQALRWQREEKRADSNGTPFDFVPDYERGVSPQFKIAESVRLPFLIGYKKFESGEE